MSEISTADAEKAFMDSLPVDDEFTDAGVDTTNKPEADAPSTESTTPDSEGTTEAPADDSFSRTDLNALLEGITDPAAQEAITRAYKGFQGDYTKSKQDLAEQRKQFEDLDPAAAREAMEFYSNLQTDPAFALEVHEYLSNAFEGMGLTPKAAAEAASEQIASEAQVVAPPADGEDPDEYLKSQVTLLNERLQSFEQREAERLAAQEQEQLAASLLQQEMALRQSDKSLREEDFDRIYDLAATNGGNLFEAAKTYNDWRNDVIQSYTAQKSTITDRVDSPSSSPAQLVRETPVDKAGNVDLEAVHQQAMKTLFGRMATGDSG